MSGTSDKARFYMEQAVPQLQEFQQHSIFTPSEIKNLVKKRSDFEHRILARGSTPLHYLSYITWESQLETLRAKRCRRLRIKTSNAQTGPARILSLFARATKKHPGDLSLWMSYLQYSRSIKSTKRFKTVLTEALRMHCTKGELWLYAAKYALEEESDFGAARAYMQRGQRFCTKRELWIEYARLEMLCLPTIGEWREKVLGVEREEEEMGRDMEGVEDGFGGNEDTIALTTSKAHKLRTNFMEEQEKTAQETLPPALNKALNGAIPLLIFDDAQKQAFYNADTAEAFFNMFAAFKHVHCQAKILDHVLTSMVERFPNEAETASCLLRLPLVGVDSRSPEFVTAFEDVLGRLKDAMAASKDKPLLTKKISAWLRPISETEGLDDAVRTVLVHTLKKLS